MAEKISTHYTFDEKPISLWSDGTLTWSLGRYVKGSGEAKTARERKRNLEAGWLVMGEAALYDSDEISKLAKVAREAVRQRWTEPLIYLRRKMNGEHLSIGKKGRTFQWKKTARFR